MRPQAGGGDEVPRSFDFLPAPPVEEGESRCCSAVGKPRSVSKVFKIEGGRFFPWEVKTKSKSGVEDKNYPSATPITILTNHEEKCAFLSK